MIAADGDGWNGCSKRLLAADGDGAEMEQFVKGGNLAIILHRLLCDRNNLQMCVRHNRTKWWLPLRKREQGVSLSGGAGAGGAGQRRKLDSRQE